MPSLFNLNHKLGTSYNNEAIKMTKKSRTEAITLLNTRSLWQDKALKAEKKQDNPEKSRMVGKSGFKLN